ncbi:hypothetical protein FB599_3392 [Herbaspirillum sp. SJZ130]|nr:hypothetical protein FB599_3392 [Herbaspirillum sp. SJZ130]TQK08558.1 hypothetical protein FB598_3331 [Herbaspirillum sp. SJZ106]
MRNRRRHLKNALHTPQETPPIPDPHLPPPELPDDDPIPVEDPPLNPRPADKPVRMRQKEDSPAFRSASGFI